MAKKAIYRKRQDDTARYFLEQYEYFWRFHGQRYAALLEKAMIAATLAKYED